jgi:hypothetical protein
MTNVARRVEKNDEGKRRGPKRERRRMTKTGRRERQLDPPHHRPALPKIPAPIVNLLPPKMVNILISLYLRFGCWKNVYPIHLYVISQFLTENLKLAAGSNKKFTKDLKEAIKKQMTQKAKGKELAEMVVFILKWKPNITNPSII